MPVKVTENGIEWKGHLKDNLKKRNVDLTKRGPKTKPDYQGLPIEEDSTAKNVVSWGYRTAEDIVRYGHDFIIGQPSLIEAAHYGQEINTQELCTSIFCESAAYKEGGFDIPRVVNDFSVNKIYGERVNSNKYPIYVVFGCKGHSKDNPSEKIIMGVNTEDDAVADAKMIATSIMWLYVQNPKNVIHRLLNELWEPERTQLDGSFLGKSLTPQPEQATTKTSKRGRPRKEKNT